MILSLYCLRDAKAASGLAGSLSMIFYVLDAVFVEP